MKLSNTFTTIAASLLFFVAIFCNVVDVVQGSSSSSSTSVGGGDISIICANSDAAASITTETLQEALVSNECWLNTTITESIYDDQPTSSSSVSTATTEECNNPDVNNKKERQMALPQPICDVSNVNFIVDVVHRARRMLEQQRYYPNNRSR